MAKETQMNVIVLAHTQLSGGLVNRFSGSTHEMWQRDEMLDSQAVLLSAIRTCYSSNKPSEILEKEGKKYFGNDGKDFDRLFSTIFGKHHHSVLEHVSYTFCIEGVSRSLLAQITRHRHASFSVQSQRYVKLGSDDKAGGFEYVIPDAIRDSYAVLDLNGKDITLENAYKSYMDWVQEYYDLFREADVLAEDARSLLPNAVATNMVVTMNLRSIFEFYAKRKEGRGAQHEITELAEKVRSEVIQIDTWLDEYFDQM